MLLIRCVICHRYLRRVAGYVEAVEGGETPHPAGQAGPRCCMKAAAFSLSPSAKPRRALARRPEKQVDWLGPVDR